MNFNQLKTAITSMIDAGVKRPFYVQGPPGAGKTDLSLEIASTYGMDRDTALNTIVRPSLMDPTDLLGIPWVDKDAEVPMTRWATNALLARLRNLSQQYEKVVLTIDELAQSTPMMFNALNGLLLDRRIGEVTLPDNVYLIATGNRTTDKAASNRIPTHTANRMVFLDYEVSLDDWVEWGLNNGVNPLLLGYLRFRPDALIDFSPDRPVNATPRSWAALSEIPEHLPRDIYHGLASGTVGEGRAAEWSAFRDVYHQLPSREDILLHPDTTPMPEEPSARYAATTLLTNMVTKDNLSQVAKYAERFTTELDAPEFEVILYKDISRLKPECRHTKEFIQWAATRGAKVLM